MKLAGSVTENGYWISNIAQMVLADGGLFWLWVFVISCIVAWKSPQLIAAAAAAWDQKRKTDALLLRKQKQLENARENRKRKG
jgi:hypothetical protein